MNYLLDIVMCVYNHEKYIAEAIEGVIMQKTDFKFRLLIGEDASTDMSKEIIKDYTQRYPDIIYPFFHNKNLGMQENASFLYAKCISKYLAICDGDDYWTHPLKLQKQVGFLENCNEYNICFHGIKIFNESSQKLEEDTITRKVNDTTTIKELSKGNFIHTPSVVLRNNFKIPKWFSSVPTGDWVLYMLAVKEKKIKSLDDCMAVYRVHDKSIWSSKGQQKKDELTLKSVNLVYENLKIHNKNVVAILRRRLDIEEPLIERFKAKILNLYNKL